MNSQVIDKLVELIRTTSSTLPADVTSALRACSRGERKGGSAAAIFKTIFDNCAISETNGTPLCQDTGTLTFFVNSSLRRKVTPKAIASAVALATKRGHLRKNTIDAVTGKSYDDNVCEGSPVIHYCDDREGVTLLMKGGGSENMSRQYSLPDASLGANRDMDGVRRCVLRAVTEIQGYGCAPGILGVVIGGDRATGYEVAKEQLLRPLDEKPTQFERRLLREANLLGIGPMGLGGKTTLLGVKVAMRPRVPASFFVTIAYMCWACRRHTIII